MKKKKENILRKLTLVGNEENPVFDITPDDESRSNITILGSENELQDT